MSSQMEEFTEKFESVEKALKYIADSQAKSEWIRKKEIAEIRQIQKRTQAQLDYITTLTGIAFEDLTFQNEKLDEAGKVLSRKRKK